MADFVKTVRAINGAIGNQMLPRIQATLRSGQGQKVGGLG